MTYENSKSLYDDLYQLAKDEGHVDDYWYWFKEIANDFLDGMHNFTDVSVKTPKAVISIVNKCVQSIQKGEIKPFYADITNGHKAIKLIEKLKKIADGKSTWSAEIFCPVDVEIKDSSGNVVGSIVDNDVIVSTDKVTMTAIDDKKYCSFNKFDKYSIKLTATGTGTMDYIVDEISDNTVYRRVTFEKLPLTPDTVYTGSIECVEMQSADSYKLIDNRNNIFEAVSDIVDLNGNIKPIAESVAPTPPPSITVNPAPSIPSSGSTAHPSGTTSTPEADIISPATNSVETFTVKVENKITDKTGKARAVRTNNDVTVTLGKANNGYYANACTSDGTTLDSIIIENGKAKLTIPKDMEFYIIIDDKSYLKYEDISAGASMLDIYDGVSSTSYGIITGFIITAALFTAIRKRKKIKD